MFSVLSLSTGIETSFIFVRPPGKDVLHFNGALLILKKQTGTKSDLPIWNSESMTALSASVLGHWLKKVFLKRRRHSRDALTEI